MKANNGQVELMRFTENIPNDWAELRPIAGNFDAKIPFHS